MAILRVPSGHNQCCGETTRRSPEVDEPLARAPATAGGGSIFVTFKVLVLVFQNSAAAEPEVPKKTFFVDFATLGALLGSW